MNAEFNVSERVVANMAGLADNNLLGFTSLNEQDGDHTTGIVTNSPSSHPMVKYKYSSLFLWQPT